MPHTKSKGQTRGRGTPVPQRKHSRVIGRGTMLRLDRKNREVELPQGGRNIVSARQRAQAERAYAGDTRRRFDVARGRKPATQDAKSRYGRGPEMTRALERKARAEGRRRKKVATSTGRPRTKLGRAPARD